MLKLALTVAYGANTRTESRGAHFRQDFPRRNDAEWLKRTLATWSNPGDSMPTLSYEPLDVRKMELPPGWRGYGAKDYIDHPDTPQRAAEVEALKQKLAGAPRFDVQEALLPYERHAARALPRAQRAHRRDVPERGRQMSDAAVQAPKPVAGDSRAFTASSGSTSCATTRRSRAACRACRPTTSRKPTA